MLRARHSIIVLFLSLELCALTVPSPSLFPHQSSGEIHVSAPALHFLSGKALSRLHDGLAVPFDFQLVIAAGSKDNVVARALERFTVSYDVIQERFSIVRLSDFRRSGLRVSAAGAESWCLDNIMIPASKLPSGPLWARLEIRSVETKQASSELSGLNLATLIELFSRPSRPQQDHWSLDSGPFQLAGLKGP